MFNRAEPTHQDGFPHKILLEDVINYLTDGLVLGLFVYLIPGQVNCDYLRLVCGCRRHNNSITIPRCTGRAKERYIIYVIAQSVIDSIYDITAICLNVA
jgi:hypothetical protein